MLIKIWYLQKYENIYYWNIFQVKGTEINNLLLTLPPILEQVEEKQRIEIDQKVFISSFS